MPARFTVAALLAVFSAFSANADSGIPPVNATPPSAPEPPGDLVFADTATLVTLSEYSDWYQALSETLTVEGFTAANGWILMPPSLQLEPNSFFVNYYNLSVNDDWVSETMNFTVMSSIPFNHFINLVNETQDPTKGWQIDSYPDR